LQSGACNKIAPELFLGKEVAATAGSSMAMVAPSGVKVLENGVSSKFKQAAQRQNELGQCMIRRVNAREKFRMKEGLRQCIRPFGGECSPGLDGIRRVPVLRKRSASHGPFL